MIQLNHKVYGQGPALIILHGLFGSLDNWVTHARQLAEHYSVFLLDQRNHGKSPHTDEWTYQVMSEDLHEFMDQHGIMQAHLLGHSMGGKAVMTFAGEYPRRIDKLIVADMGIRQYPPQHTGIIDALLSVPLGLIGSRQDVSEHLLSKISNKSIVQFLLKSLGRDDEKRLQWKFNLQVIAEKYEEILAPIQNEFPYDGETLFLSGEESNYVSQKDHPAILEQFPNARFEVLQKAGHWLHADRPKAFLESLIRFLNG